MESLSEPVKTCTKCGVLKKFSEFARRNNRKHGYQSRCNVCAAEAARIALEKKSKDPVFVSNNIVRLRLAYRHYRESGKCFDCGVIVEDGHTYCPEHREKRRLRELERRRSEHKPRICRHCQKEPAIYRGFYCSKCGKLPQRRRTYMTQFYREQRLDVFRKLGGAICACCGEDNPLFLTIDHIGGNGNKHRREISKDGSGLGVSLYRWLKKNNYPPGFQVLCFNCNCGKYRNGGICPHEELRRNQEA